MAKKTYDIFYSIGADCACASYLNRHNLRLCSGPFDWLTNANFQTRLEIILDDFKDFINAKDLIPLTKDQAIPIDHKHDYYQNIRNNFYYYHDFPSQDNFENSFVIAQEKYCRRIRKFLNNLGSGQRILLIWLAHNHIVDDLVMNNLCQKIINKFTNVDFLIIENDATKNGQEFEKIIFSQKIIKYKLDTASFVESKDQMMGNIKNCDRIFKQYQLPFLIRQKIYWQNFYLKSRKFFLKILIAAIPVRLWRKSIRNSLIRSRDIA